MEGHILTDKMHPYSFSLKKFYGAPCLLFSLLLLFIYFFALPFLRIIYLCYIICLQKRTVSKPNPEDLEPSRRSLRIQRIQPNGEPMQPPPPPVAEVIQQLHIQCTYIILLPALLLVLVHIHVHVGSYLHINFKCFLELLWN